MKTPTARKLASGNWFIRVQVDGQSYPITRPTEKEAVAEALAIKARLKTASHTSGRDKTLEQALNDYIDARRNILSPSTIRGYCLIRDNRFQSVRYIKLSNIRPEKWQSLVNLEARCVSAKTLKNAWGLVHTVIKAATGIDVEVSLPQVIPNEREFLDSDEIGIFIQAIKGKQVETAALLALSSLRRSEILALQWEDVDLKKRTLSVRAATVPNEDNEFVRKDETKNSHSRRTVPIIDPLYDVLSARQQKKGPVVTMTGSGIYKSVNTICERNGLPQVGTHGLRHSYASLAYHLHIPERITMQLGGWSDIQTMHKIYTHIAQKDVVKEASKFTAFFAPPAPDAQAGS